MRFTHQQCEAYAEEVLALDERARLLKLWGLCELAVREDAPGLPIVVGLILRDRGAPDLAEYAFSVALRVPGARGGAMFELSVLASLRGDPAGASALLARLEAEFPLNAYQQRHYAHQLCRLGDLAGAERRLDQSVLMEPGSLSECIELRQFGDYFSRFPVDLAFQRGVDLLETYRFQTPGEVGEAIRAAVRDRRPYALMRLNDGEGSILHLSVEDEAGYPALYQRNRREFHRMWFGHEGMLHDPDFLTAVKEINDAVGNADCLGAYINNSLQGEYAWGSLRNVPCLFNVTRKLEQLRDSAPDQARAIAMADPVIHQLLLYSGELERTLEAQDRIGLVSCHAALPEALSRRFGLSEVFFHKTPGEAAITRGVEPEPFAVWHERLKGELRQARPGVLYLVAAGIFSKIYCDLIKRAGGVAVDLGAVADIWMKAPTRTFGEAAQEHVLA